MDSDQQPPSAAPSVRLVGIQFRPAGTIVTYSAGNLALEVGVPVVVEAERGQRLATVVTPSRAATPGDATAPLPRVLRRADGNDIERDDRLRIRARDATRTCLERIRERQLQMKLVNTDYAPDGGKVVFYFAAENRVDFRDLVRELAHALHTRVELKQVGPRDEAKELGAVGPCGRELCCSSWLRNPGGVSLKMAKVQGLAPHPSRLAGMCGRLKCCLRYEYDTYVELGRALPAIGSTVVSVKGDGVVTRQNLLKQTVIIRSAEGVEAEATLEDLVEKKAQ